MGHPTQNATHDTPASASGPPDNWTLQSGSHDHGAYTPDTVDMAVVGFSVVVLVFALLLTARYLIRPGETDEDHIKRRILRDGGQA